MKKIVLALAILFTLTVTAFFWIKLRPKVFQKPVPMCGLENCHGFNPICGSNIPKSCDAMYELGDLCRQLVSCQVIDSSCQLVALPEFTTCKSCVENCDENSGSDSAKLFACESTCGARNWSP